MQNSLENTIEKLLELEVKNTLPDVRIHIGNEVLSPGFNNPTHETEVWLGYSGSVYSGVNLSDNNTLRSRIARFQVVLYSRNIGRTNEMLNANELLRKALLSKSLNIGTTNNPQFIKVFLTNESVLPASLPVKGYSVLIINLETEPLFPED